jgi:hypothetical protein
MFRRREPRWIFARFPLNGPKTLAFAMPVHIPGSGSDGWTVRHLLLFVAIAAGNSFFLGRSAQDQGQAELTVKR